MKKITLLFAFLLIVFVGKAQETSCDRFCIMGMSVDTSVAGNHTLSVAVFNANDTSTYLEYPIVRVTNSAGDTIANKAGLSYMFYQRGGTIVTHVLPTILDSLLPIGFIANVYLTDGVSDSTCSHIYPSACFTGINEPVAVNALDIYPNPATSLIHLRFGEANTKQIRINMYDATGNLVRDYTTTHKELIIDRDGLANGIYFITVNNDQIRLTKKLIIE